MQVTKNLEAIGKLSKEEIHKRALREALEYVAKKW